MLLSLDIGFRFTGWSVFNKNMIIAYGCITTKKSKLKSARTADDDARCCAEIANQLTVIIKEYKVKAVIGEMPHGGAQSARPNRTMALASGVTSAVAAVLNLPVSWTTPLQVKLAATGRNKADKEDVIKGIKEKFKYFKFEYSDETEFEHIADSIGAYLALKSDNLVIMYG